MDGEKNPSFASLRTTTPRKSPPELGCSNDGTTNPRTTARPRTSTFRAPSHRYKADLEHRKVEDGDVIAGTVATSSTTLPARAPVAAVEFEDGDRDLSSRRKASGSATSYRSASAPRSHPGTRSRWPRSQRGSRCARRIQPR